MCDTIVAPPKSTGLTAMLFGKNSDRQCNEAQAVEYFPAARHAADATVACTYITVPQVAHTCAVLLCRPFWTWGAEMGANEHGVAIGNEGVHARSPAPQRPALIGMDLVRLALERAHTASEAVHVMTSLLGRYGQGGNCGHLSPSYYNNAFMIADAREAFVLETIEREWLLERVSTVRAISNEYSIGGDVAEHSSGLPVLLREFGSLGVVPLNYAELIRDPTKTHIGSARGRRARATALLEASAGRLRVADIFRILRDHDPTGDAPRNWTPESASAYSLCIHARGLERPSQTTGSLASDIDARSSVHWVTGTAAPCLSIFKPVMLDVPLPTHGPRPTDQFDAATLWWRHERLHRAVLLDDFAKYLQQLQPERDELEMRFIKRMAAVREHGSASDRTRVIAECWREARELEDRWHQRVAQPARRNTSYYLSWVKMNDLAHLEY